MSLFKFLLVLFVILSPLSSHAFSNMRLAITVSVMCLEKVWVEMREEASSAASAVFESSDAATVYSNGDGSSVSAGCENNLASDLQYAWALDKKEGESQFVFYGVVCSSTFRDDITTSLGETITGALNQYTSTTFPLAMSTPVIVFEEDVDDCEMPPGSIG